jgi:hypothetical protein
LILNGAARHHTGEAQAYSGMFKFETTIDIFTCSRVVASVGKKDWKTGLVPSTVKDPGQL